MQAKVEGTDARGTPIQLWCLKNNKVLACSTEHLPPAQWRPGVPWADELKASGNLAEVEG
jgi:hypothetical protein